MAEIEVGARVRFHSGELTWTVLAVDCELAWLRSEIGAHCQEETFQLELLPDTLMVELPREDCQFYENWGLRRGNIHERLAAACRKSLETP